VETIPEGMRFEEIIQLIVHSNQSNFPRVIFMLSRKDVIRTYHDELERIKNERPNDFERMG
jgi:hypothetical protein